MDPLQESQKKWSRHSLLKKTPTNQRIRNVLLMEEIRLTIWCGKTPHYLQGLFTSQVVQDFFHKLTVSTSNIQVLFNKPVQVTQGFS